MNFAGAQRSQPQTALGAGVIGESGARGAERARGDWHGALMPFTGRSDNSDRQPSCSKGAAHWEMPSFDRRGGGVEGIPNASFAVAQFGLVGADIDDGQHFGNFGRSLIELFLS